MEVPFVQAQDQHFTTRSQRVVTECLLTRSMLIKMYVHDINTRFRAGAILSIINGMSTFVNEDHILDWHACHICYPLEIRLLLYNFQR